MPLISLYESSPDAIQDMNIQQIVGLAGDGQLLDDSDCQREIRDYLKRADPGQLEAYANYCLDSAFTDSGLVLQDIVNEMGYRLGFQVENGRYRGKRNENGFDGLWSSDAAGSFVVETKTSAAYTIPLETIAQYRDGLAREERIKPAAAILFVVGRQETAALEQQIRGSPFAWTMRIVSIHALIKLMKVNLDSLTDEVTAQIHRIFQPVDYTRVDPIVDIMFTTSEDREGMQEPNPEAVVESEFEKTVKKSSREDIKIKRAEIVETFSKLKGAKLIRRKAAYFSDPTDQLRVGVPVSKRHDKAYRNYWYAYPSSMRSFLEDGGESYIILGCLDKNEAYAVPYSAMEQYREGMHITPEKENRKEYWHVFINDANGSAKLYLEKNKTEQDLRKYKFSW